MSVRLGYEISLAGHDVGAARARVTALWHAAKKAGFVSVSRILDRDGDDVDFEEHESGTLEREVLVSASDYPGDRKPTAVIGFRVIVDEPSGVGFNVGLTRWPGGRRWFWQESTDNLLAIATPKSGGMDALVRAFQKILAYLDSVRELGVKPRDSDTGYLRHRDEARLRARLLANLEHVAALAGRLGEAFPEDGVESYVKERPDYEHLEARGRAHDEETGRGR